MRIIVNVNFAKKIDRVKIRRIIFIIFSIIFSSFVSTGRLDLKWDERIIGTLLLLLLLLRISRNGSSSTTVVVVGGEHQQQRRRRRRSDDPAAASRRPPAPASSGPPVAPAPPGRGLPSDMTASGFMQPARVWPLGATRRPPQPLPPSYSAAHLSRREEVRMERNNVRSVVRRSMAAESGAAARAVATPETSSAELTEALAEEASALRQYRLQGGAAAAVGSLLTWWLQHRDPFSASSSASAPSSVTAVLLGVARDNPVAASSIAGLLAGVLLLPPADCEKSDPAFLRLHAFCGAFVGMASASR